MIISKENRKEVLLNAGVHESFLEALNGIELDSNLRFMIRKPYSFYNHIDNIYSNYRCIHGYDIAPIFEGANGDVFYVYLFNDKEQKFAHFELENDELYSDHGKSFDLMLASFLIDLYEFAEDLSIEELVKKGEKNGSGVCPGIVLSSGKS